MKIYGLSLLAIFVVVVTISLLNNYDWARGNESSSPRSETPVRNLRQLKKVHSDEKPVCDLSKVKRVQPDEMPVRDLSQAKKVHSDDNRTMINSAAYVHLYDFGILELNPQSVWNSAESEEKGVTNLQSDCADLKINYQYRDNVVKLSRMQLNWRNALDGKYLLCANYNYENVFNKKKRFSCIGRIVVPCRWSGDNNYKKVGELVFDALEIEYDGDPEKIERGEFSKIPAPHGCGFTTD